MRRTRTQARIDAERRVTRESELVDDASRRQRERHTSPLRSGKCPLRMTAGEQNLKLVGEQLVSRFARLARPVSKTACR